MSDETGNLLVKVNVKKNVEEGPMMASAELLEALVSSSKADSVSNMANGVIWVASGLFGLV
jgi:RNA-binding protein YhbY